MTTSVANPKELLPQECQTALIAAARIANTEIKRFITNTDTWSIMPIEEKVHKIRSTFYSKLLDNLSAVAPDEVSVVPINHNMGSKLGTVNIIVIGDIGLHIISSLREVCPTLRVFRERQNQKTLFDMDEVESVLGHHQIFQCIYKRRGNIIAELKIMDRYDPDSEPLILVVVEGEFAPQVNDNEVEAPRITWKSLTQKGAEDGKDVAQ